MHLNIAAAGCAKSRVRTPQIGFRQSDIGQRTPVHPIESPPAGPRIEPGLDPENQAQKGRSPEE